MRTGRVRRGGALPASSAAVLVSLATALATLFSSTAAAGAGATGLPPAAHTTLHLVTFDAAGTAGYAGPLTTSGYRAMLSGQQESALLAVGAPAPVYRWTTALSGFAVELTPEQVERMRRQPQVATVEENAVRPLVTATAPSGGQSVTRSTRGGQGVVIGVVDTGIWPENPLFADSPALEGDDVTRRGYDGGCRAGEDWSRDACNDKIVGAQWFVAGFGEDRLAADEPLSARDVRGHGTQVASIAAGNAEVSVGVPGLRRTFGGVAPRARLATYKSCWSAPDPDDDGCATADLVTAVDRATRDGIDVLNLSVSGAAGIDTVERALLGAAEAGVVVVAAAGNDGTDAYAGHVSPWVTTVGGLTTGAHRGEVVFGDRTVRGTMTTREPVSGRLVAARDVTATGARPAAAAVCTPGALDASAAAGRIVLCERGVIGRVEKSAAVARAGGAGMVLVDTRPGAPAHDLHAVPTVHLRAGAARALLDRLASHPLVDVTLRPAPEAAGPVQIAPWSAGGDPAGSVLKPDVVAPATGLLAGTPPGVTGSRWALASGTSVAAAWTSGTAAVLRARHPDWSAAVVRSALATSAAEVDDTLREGAGAVRLRPALATTLAHDVAPGDYRAWLSGDLPTVNTASFLLRGGTTATREVTNVGPRAGRWQASVTGFERYAVSVAPAALALRPGGSASYRVTVSEGSVAGGIDKGAVLWTAPDGRQVRVPVVIGR